MSDVWAHCAGCDRWFYAPAAQSTRSSDVRCPVCSLSPDRLEDRATGDVSAACDVA